ncbi:hypothetical protein F5B20DRAFT_586760 [Whalleya microplaca]|nr:hypothetical protein F5B20DRAFT_586760 [Whalleya microplaca]
MASTPVTSTRSWAQITQGSDAVSDNSQPQVPAATTSSEPEVPVISDDVNSDNVDTTSNTDGWVTFSKKKSNKTVPATPAKESEQQIPSADGNSTAKANGAKPKPQPQRRNTNNNRRRNRDEQIQGRLPQWYSRPGWDQRSRELPQSVIDTKVVLVRPEDVHKDGSRK